MTGPTDFVMPSLGADMDSGTITEWLVKVGDSVDRGDIVAIVETDKADIDIEVWEPGVVSEIVVSPGEQVAVGTVLARLNVPAGTVEKKQLSAPSAPPVSTSGPTSPAPSIAPAPKQRAARIPASPLARRLAEEHGIDLATVDGTGPGGAVVAADLATARRSDEKARHGDEPRKPPPSPGSNVRQLDEKRVMSSNARMRRAIAELLARSKREIPHYYLATDIDLDVMLRWLGDVNATRPVEDRIIPAAVLMKAVASATARHPEFNGFWIDDDFQSGEGVHLGVAVSLREGGLVAPAIHNADQLSVEELMAALRDVVGRARAGRLKGSEMTDPTLTVSNLGDRGVEVVHGVIYPPQVALIGLGKIAKRPVVSDDLVVSHPMVTVTLAADHRATDGQVGARFLNTINRLVQEPEKL